MQIQVNKIEKLATFEMKSGYYIKLLAPESMKWKHQNGQNILQLEITKAIIVHRNLIDKTFQQNLKSFIQIYSTQIIWVATLDFIIKTYFFQTLLT